MCHLKPSSVIKLILFSCRLIVNPMNGTGKVFESLFGV